VIPTELAGKQFVCQRKTIDCIFKSIDWYFYLL